MNAVVRYEYGSAEADRRVKKLGYCRVHMPSVPRTGSTWFRAMFETATGQPSFSMWQGTLPVVRSTETRKRYSSDQQKGTAVIATTAEFFSKMHRSFHACSGKSMILE